MADKDEKSLDHQLCFAIYATSLAFTRAYRPLLEELDLTYPQYLAMNLLWREDGLTVGQLAERLSHGLAEVIARHKAPWHVVRVGARVEFICAPGPLRNGTEAGHAHQPQVEAAVHTALLNRGCLIAPFHNMMLVSPVTKNRQIDRLIAAFDEILSELTR